MVVIIHKRNSIIYDFEHIVDNLFNIIHNYKGIKHRILLMTTDEFVNAIKFGQKLHLNVYGLWGHYYYTMKELRALSIIDKKFPIIIKNVYINGCVIVDFDYK